MGLEIRLGMTFLLGKKMNFLLEKKMNCVGRMIYIPNLCDVIELVGAQGGSVLLGRRWGWKFGLE